MNSRTLTNILLAVIALALAGPPVVRFAQSTTFFEDFQQRRERELEKKRVMDVCRAKGYKSPSSMRYCLQHIQGRWDLIDD